MAPQLTRMNGPAARGERLWIIRAISSLPVPVSPRMRTGASDLATSPTRSKTARKPESVPTTVSSPISLRPSRLSNECFSASAAARMRGHFPQTTVVFQSGGKWLQQQFHDFCMLAVKRCIVGRRYDQDAARATGIGEWSKQNVAPGTGGHKDLQGSICPARLSAVGDISPSAPPAYFLDHG